MRIRAADTVPRAAALAAVAALTVLSAVAMPSCGRWTDGSVAGGLFRQYEYDEDLYLSLDGSAVVYVNTSIAALNALRGTSFSSAPNAPLDRDGLRAFFTTPVTRVNGQISASRRSNRRFVHVKLDVDDVSRLGEAAPFAWSTYDFTRDGGLYVYRQTVGPAAGQRVGDVGWNGHEVVAFRLHLPSKIRYQNNGRSPERGNILVWQQSLSDRIRGVPLMLDARMDPESILYRTLSLFAATFGAVAITFVVIIWWVRHRAPVEKEIA
jgi:hypothetical protein